MYKYKCTSRYKMLIIIDNVIKEVLPQEKIETHTPVTNKFLKKLYDYPKKEKNIKKIPKESK